MPDTLLATAAEDPDADRIRLLTALVAGLGIGGIAVQNVLGAEFNRYMDIQQDINFRIREAFEALGVEFAFPTQTLLIAGAAGMPEPPQRNAA